MVGAFREVPDTVGRAVPSPSTLRARASSVRGPYLARPRVLVPAAMTASFSRPIRAGSAGSSVSAMSGTTPAGHPVVAVAARHLVALDVLAAAGLVGLWLGPLVTDRAGF